MPRQKYSDILADILERKHSKCICSSAFITDFNIVKSRPQSGGCQFGPDCQFSVTCDYNQAKCTCSPQCTCSPDTHKPSSSREKGPSGICTEPDCICVGTCLCKSEESLLARAIYRPPTHCDKAKCICSVCLCRPDDSAPNLLPSYFRNTVKMEAHKLMSDEMLKKECAEIKQLLHEHEESKKKEQNRFREPTKFLPHKPQVSVEGEVKRAPLQKTVSINEDIEPTSKPASFKSFERKSSVAEESRRLSARNSRRSILKSNLSIEEPKSQIPSTKKEDKVRRKEKSVKRDYPKHKPQYLSSKTKSSKMYSRRTSVKPKPLRIRYYYSGGTEHYGVKLGHKHCLDRPPLVPKHMGWLWNIEDHSKGLRERKGWPPGFIGKSIKNMIKVMKRLEESHQNLTEKHVETPQRKKPPEYEWEMSELKRDEPPLLHIHKKGRTYNITFCPKNSDEDIGPIPIPFSITEKKRDSDSESSDSTLEFELHSPKPRGKFNGPQLVRKKKSATVPQEINETLIVPPPSTTKLPKKKVAKKKSKGSEENKILWEEQETQIQNIA